MLSHEGRGGARFREAHHVVENIAEIFVLEIRRGLRTNLASQHRYHHLTLVCSDLTSGLMPLLCGIFLVGLPKNITLFRTGGGERVKGVRYGRRCVRTFDSGQAFFAEIVKVSLQHRGRVYQLPRETYTFIVPCDLVTNNAQCVEQSHDCLGLARSGRTCIVEAMIESLATFNSTRGGV